MSTYDKVKILVVGDSGVGKTSVVHMMCNGKPLQNPAWTVGCALEVKIHDYKAATSSQRTFFIDLWDVGGSATHTNTRNVFYNGVNGVILVHDLTNRKSEINLHKWIVEILNRSSIIDNSFSINNSPGSNTGEDDFDPEVFVGTPNMPPIFVIGTKLDGLDGRRPSISKIHSIAEELRADEIFVNCLDPKYLTPGSTGAVKLSRFFDTVIEKRFFRDMGYQSSDRKRL